MNSPPGARATQTPTGMSSATVRTSSSSDSCSECTAEPMMREGAARRRRKSSVREVALDLLEDLGLREDPDELAVDVAVLHLEAEDRERALDGDRLLVRAVARGERVEDVGDRHDLRGQRD